MTLPLLNALTWSSSRRLSLRPAPRHLKPAPDKAGPLAHQLWEGTAGVRAELQHSLFMQRLLYGQWGTSIYGQWSFGLHIVSYLQCLRALYQALEAALQEHQNHPTVAGFLLPELFRSPIISLDLQSFGLQGEETFFPKSTVTLHVERLRTLSQEAPHLLVAHAYARYVSELLSGTFQGDLIARTFELEGSEGTLLFRAVPPHEIENYRRQAEQKLNQLLLRNAEADEVVQEAKLAFRLTCLLFEELTRHSLGIRTSEAKGARP